MNKRQIVASLNSIANELDTKGLFKEANEVTEVMVKISQIAGMNETRRGHPSLPNNPRTPSAPMPPYDLVTDSEPMPPYDLVTDSPKSVNKPNVSKKPTNSSTPKNSVGLSRWVNKAENIYSAWVSKGAKANSTDAEGLIQDIIDYMEKVKLNMKPSLHTAADYKIDKVKAMKLAIASGITLPGFTVPVPYGAMTGFPAKDVNPFTYDPSKRLTGTQLDYQARNEGKSY